MPKSSVRILNQRDKCVNFIAGDTGLLDKQTSSAAPDSTKVNSRVRLSTANMAHCTLSDSPLTHQISEPGSDTSVVQTSQVRTVTLLALLGATNQKPRRWGDVNLKYL
jgi:hypothetical protein